ncbi:hypothetical protein Taro_015998 [Colocasia esculenta]|uniref:Uncharacterized protein n=1 Tax=Colocasia esculenta TaxID=4460 RepID=A0A843UNX8_COLES|nr:hypothetical protein [Colocasia esculenta]
MHGVARCALTLGNQTQLERNKGEQDITMAISQNTPTSRNTSARLECPINIKLEATKRRQELANNPERQRGPSRHMNTPTTVPADTSGRIQAATVDSHKVAVDSY